MRGTTKGALLAYSAVVAAAFVVVVRFWALPPWLALLAMLTAVTLGALVVAALGRPGRPPGRSLTRR